MDPGNTDLGTNRIILKGQQFRTLTATPRYHKEIIAPGTGYCNVLSQ